MWISYNDSEVRKFHPICEAALNTALRMLSKSTDYEVRHHQFAGTLEMDFAVVNKSTEKVAVVVEVKRTIADVGSTRYQFQAMSYVQMLYPAQTESPYYMLTNLECTCLFRYDKDKPNVYEQMLLPGIDLLARFEELTEQDFTRQLAERYALYLQRIFSGYKEYMHTFAQFGNYMEVNKDNPMQWSAGLAVMGYEYIRGALKKFGRTDMLDISKYHKQLRQVCEKGAKVDFSAIFSLPDESLQANQWPRVSSDLLHELNTLGQNYGDADAIASVIHQVVAHGNEHDGVVATDMELARVLAVVAKSICGSLAADDVVFDPAAGSGNLISGVLQTYTGLKPHQLKANDIDKRLLQLLSLRLGLKFPRQISADNAPIITALNITELTPADFSKVRMVVMNPPYVNATECRARREKLFRRLEELRGEAKTKVEAMQLEGPFLELVSAYLKTGTTMAVIMPWTILTSRGGAGQTIRRFLLEDFGLQLVMLYPGEGLFESVTKDTIILVGTKGASDQSVRIVYSNDCVADINLDTLEHVLSLQFTSEVTMCEGSFECLTVSRSDLYASIKDGWRKTSKSMIDGLMFVRHQLAPCRKLCLTERLGLSYYRGQIGNRGANDLMYVTSIKKFFQSIPPAYLQPSRLQIGLRMAKLRSMEVGMGDQQFMKADNLPDEVLTDIIKRYRKYERLQGKQSKKPKTDDALKDIWRKESGYVVPAGAVLMPRDLRETGRVYRCTYDSYVSSNFFIINPHDAIYSKILASWMSTIFYQINCEVSSKNQEGTRKMEKLDFNKTYVPFSPELSPMEIERILNTEVSEFLRLKNPQIRKVDEVWCEVLFGKVDRQLLSEARNLLMALATERNA